MPLARLRPHRHDALIALAGFAGGLALWLLGLYSNQETGRAHGALVLVPLGAMCLAVLGRRTAQPWALLLGVAAMAGDAVTGSLLATAVLFTDVVYAAVLYGRPSLARVVVPASVLVTVAVTLGTLAAFRRPEALLLGIVCGLVTIGPACTGAIIRDHRNAAAAERLRAEQTALLAEMDRTQAVVAERARMARELHDVVANHLSAIAIHSTAALSQEREDPALTRDALGVIRENSVRGLAEMRRLIGLLRDAGADSGPAVSPTLDGLDALLDRARDTADEGFRFTLRDERGPGPLPAPVGLAAYRVAQEAVTNALKHASPGPVTVRLDHEPPGPLTVEVTSPFDGRGGPGPRAPGSGAGLIGMRERVELLGGTLAAGPEPGNGRGPGDDGAGGAKVWTVRAVLPVEGREG
ncbi:sensor histidine kinase [Streptomyces daliensis]|uniref:histidine kinase n=1 Tax=Streptomyces daliensis TaxID=299421 RepID=A0A8T4IVC8_9ACTN|nr:two-component sensor histidine kinase [Streptomyces daliensis]